VETGAEAQKSRPKRYLRAFSGSGYVQVRGFGFSPEAAPS